MSNKIWRPEIITDKTIKLLEYSFLQWFTDEQAYLYAWICKSTLYNFCNENPLFKEKKELLKRNIWMRAKININKEIEKWDPKTSMWYLERKEKTEFSPNLNRWFNDEENNDRLKSVTVQIIWCGSE